MAQNIGPANGTTFNTANMKPESGDQIDALWGQNLVDNVCFNSYKPYIAYNIGPSYAFFPLTSPTYYLEFYGTVEIPLDWSFGTIIGTFWGTTTAVNAKIDISIDGTPWAHHLSISSGAGFNGASWIIPKVVGVSKGHGTNINLTYSILSDHVLVHSFLKIQSFYGFYKA